MSNTSKDAPSESKSLPPAELADNYRRQLIETARRCIAMRKHLRGCVCRWRRAARTGPNSELALVFIMRPGEAPTTEVWPYEPFDFAVCFLVLMFLPVQLRVGFLHKLQRLTKPGGALVIVDKIQMPPGYVGTAFSRLTLQQKLAVGARPEAILQKELSLAGYQRPLDPRLMPKSAQPFFQVGEFVGWIIEASEDRVRG